ncbi:MAG: uracil-DNA glycosylase [Planctomycetes bacterium]|nr:uracil-DNA glycosylase [Planctomycetota bacterium]
MSGKEPLDQELARALALALEAERLFGIEELPRGPLVAAPAEPAIEPEAEPARPEPAATPSASVAREGAAPVALAELADRIAACRDCRLAETRCRTVPGQGAAPARLMFVGEAPGADEDQSGLAFVGRAGQLLGKMIQAMGLEREQVFIANILKCRPPENRRPQPDEVGACFHHLLDQIDLVNPELICALGATAAGNLLERQDGIGRLRGRVFDFQGRKLVATYHPSYLLREPAKKREAWEDLKLVMRLLGLEAPPAPDRRA